MKNGLNIKKDSSIEEGRGDTWLLLFPALGGGLVGMRMGSEAGGLLGGLLGFAVGACIGGVGALFFLLLLATGG